MKMHEAYEAGRVLRATFLIALSLAMVGCSEDAPMAPPQPGTLIVTFTTPAVDDGAALFALTGPGMTNVSVANANYELSWRLVGPSELRAIVLGDLASGPVFTIHVPDVNRVADYSGSMTEVADRSGELRANTSGHTISLATLDGSECCSPGG